ncbi:MAG: patatin-like phospholipase family protein [Spirulina sp.]
MVAWNDVRRQYKLKLTSSEIAEIQTRMPDRDRTDGCIYVDGAFEGGGVWGLAFLGALRVFADLGVQWRKVVGTSSGSITAALVASGYSTDELEELIGNAHYMQVFLHQKTSFWIPDVDLSHDMLSLGWVLKAGLALIATGQRGMYSSLPFKHWLLDKLAQKQIKTFADITAKNGRGELKVVVSDLSYGRMLVLPNDLSNGMKDDFSVAEAVRLSASLPLFFEPGEIQGRTIVDGGIFSRFPIWIFDVEVKQRSRQQCPRWPTFGLRILEKKTKPDRINNLYDVGKAILQTSGVARDEYDIKQTWRDRIIEIDVAPVGVSSTEFNLNDEQKIALYRLGYERAKNFLLHEWDWHKHLKGRGYDPKTCGQQDKEILHLTAS